MSMPDLGPDGRHLQTSNPADEEPDLCVWCGGNAEDGATVPVVTREEAESVHPSMKTIPAWWYGDGHGWGIRLCEACNDYRIGEWPAEDTEHGLAAVCDALGIDNMLHPFVRGERAVAKIKALQAERDAYLDEVQLTNENEARIMADLLATRDNFARLIANVASYDEILHAWKGRRDQLNGHKVTRGDLFRALDVKMGMDPTLNEHRFAFSAPLRKDGATEGGEA